MLFVFFVLISLITALMLSALTKFISLSSFNKTLKEIGIHKQLRPLLTVGVPAFESILAFLLCFKETRLLSLSLIIVLLLIFSFITIKMMGSAKKVNCNCFGNIVSETFGWKTISHIVLFMMMDLIIGINVNRTYQMVFKIDEVIVSVLICLGFFGLYALRSEFLEYKKKGVR